MNKSNIFKKAASTALVAACMMFCFASCDKTDDPKPNPAGDHPADTLSCDYFIKNPTAVLKDDPEAPVDYIITCLASVEGKLTIEPGVVVAFAQDAGLKFYPESSLSMEGTADKPIVLTGTEKTKGFWRGVSLESTNADNIMKYVTIDYAGGKKIQTSSIGALLIYGKSLITMDHCTISNSKHNGLYTSLSSLDENEQTITMTNCVFTKNDIPVRTGSSFVRMLNSSNSFVGNTHDYIYFHEGDITCNATWPKLDVPYLVEKGEVHLNKGVITIEPGVEIIMTAQSGFRLYDEGSLVMVGTAQDPIIIRGEQDVPGYWNKIRIDSPSPLNKIGFVKIQNAGNTTGHPNGAVWLYPYGYLNIHDVAFTKCFEYAVSLRLHSAAFHLEYENLSLVNTPKLFSDFDGNELTNP